MLLSDSCVACDGTEVGDAPLHKTEQIIYYLLTLWLGISVFFKSSLIFKAHYHSAALLLNSIRSCSSLVGFPVLFVGVHPTSITS